MQNRLVLTGIPPAVPRLPKALDSLKDLVEDHACWVDRFAFLSTTTPITTATSSGKDIACVAAAVELHIENVRDKAIQSLNGLVVSMDDEGGILLPDDDDYDNNETDEATINNNKRSRSSKYTISFQIHAFPATKTQSNELIQKCPLQSDDDDDGAGEKRMEKQTLHLPLPLPDNPNNTIELSVRKSEEHGGTGTYPWRGGLILSRQICHWAAAASSSIADQESRKNSTNETNGEETTIRGASCIMDDYFKLLFCGGKKKKVLELGAGAAGLPSLTLGKIGNSSSSNYERMDLICSDGVDEIVNALQVNITDNGLDDCIQVQHLDWNDYTTTNNMDDGKESAVTSSTATKKVDTILFADCIYNDECAIALRQTISHLLKPGGTVIGVLPDFRVGLQLFERKMRENHFMSTDIPIIGMEEGQQYDAFACSGGGGKEYRLVLWRDAR